MQLARITAALLVAVLLAASGGPASANPADSRPVVIESGPASVNITDPLTGEAVTVDGWLTRELQSTQPTGNDAGIQSLGCETSHFLGNPYHSVDPSGTGYARGYAYVERGAGCPTSYWSHYLYRNRAWGSEKIAERSYATAAGTRTNSYLSYNCTGTTFTYWAYRTTHSPSTSSDVRFSC